MELSDLDLELSTPDMDFFRTGDEPVGTGRGADGIRSSRYRIEFVTESVTMAHLTSVSKPLPRERQSQGSNFILPAPRRCSLPPTLGSVTLPLRSREGVPQSIETSLRHRNGSPDLQDDGDGQRTKLRALFQQSAALSLDPYSFPSSPAHRRPRSSRTLGRTSKFTITSYGAVELPILASISTRCTADSRTFKYRARGVVVTDRHEEDEPPVPQGGSVWLQFGCTDAFDLIKYYSSDRKQTCSIGYQYTYSFDGMRLCWFMALLCWSRLLSDLIEVEPTTAYLSLALRYDGKHSLTPRSSS
ncbi:hypothetical protein CONLIGDRAFT_444346 [Coniochaeta ligniaria NRRL 30616]|uniref:Uncharacterized protein n=1 Tax=Coniochaeta ligniaria NRRL 30616 TaxID=1408157 RepID=A0A1J7IJ58_9PEZI|nr:hypothetical protein CONLIGDRAFT_444346 [Coniochaeta ligniaria NRRL 30616]